MLFWAMSAPATAQQARSGYKGWKAPNRASIPVQVGVGPAGVMVGAPSLSSGYSGAVFEDQPLHLGVRIDLEAVITADLVREHPKVVPRQYRSRLLAAGEVRYRPGIAALLPRTVYFSPKLQNTGMYGATWSLLGAGLALSPSPFRVSLGASLIGTALFMHSETLPSPTFFVRPGVDITLDIEIQVARDFGLSFGWSSMMHIPQALGGPVLDLDGDEGSIWHIGQFYVQGNVRFPYHMTYR
ncbi:hypothetical protein FRC91_19055 [Bradymonadales bacterium TMQ1]|uniref:Outer membrane protein beta-barrel domain-containing protein n=1 Tax=Lujinxingia sediminis TaxID=2480984 RepID=A0ABY0CNC1_9DELT|nr:hypothetical protein [Lujinxingia sediminis]RVU41460.1 hypothetical protein EA187_18475 [Lujinxingia sediminis]TXC68450.1 hypothetical protein FRC91_19055 [Bradymonadales bacterium TMQ1]